MSREEFIELIGPYLDGELSGEERETVEGYLASSEEYRKLAAEAEELTRLAKNDRPPEVSDERWRKMLSEIRDGKTNQPFAVVSARPRCDPLRKARPFWRGSKAAGGRIRTDDGFHPNRS